jgi:hypothetical protein
LRRGHNWQIICLLALATGRIFVNLLDQTKTLNRGYSLGKAQKEKHMYRILFALIAATGLMVSTGCGDPKPAGTDKAKPAADKAKPMADKAKPAADADKAKPAADADKAKAPAK